VKDLKEKREGEETEGWKEERRAEGIKEEGRKSKAGSGHRRPRGRSVG
jgi:hypothetical protein